MTTVVNMIPRSLSGETNQDSEPNLAVNPANPKQIVGSAFTPDPMGGPNRPDLRLDGRRAHVDAQQHRAEHAGSSHRHGRHHAGASPARSSRLYSAILDGGTGDFEVHPHRRLRPASTAMTPLETRARRGPALSCRHATVMGGAGVGKDRVYIGVNDFNAPGRQTATHRADARRRRRRAGLHLGPDRDARRRSGRTGRQVRPAVHGDGTVYAALLPLDRLDRQLPREHARHHQRRA